MPASDRSKAIWEKESENLKGGGYNNTAIN